jgi:hypothetical protein
MLCLAGTEDVLGRSTMGVESKVSCNVSISTCGSNSELNPRNRSWGLCIGLCMYVPVRCALPFRTQSLQLSVHHAPVNLKVEKAHAVSHPLP